MYGSSLWLFLEILITIIVQVDSQVLTVTKPSVVTFSDYQPPLAINHHPYRESVLPDHNRAIFSLDLKPGKYLITHGGRLSPDTLKPIRWSIDETVGKFTRGIHRDYVVGGISAVQLDGLVFQVTNPQTYRLVGSAGAWVKSSSLKPNTPKITYELDGDILGERTGSASVIVTRLLTPGIHRFNSWVTGVTGDIWCVCPSLSTGYVTTHWLGVWPYRPTDQLQIVNTMTERDPLVVAGKYRISGSDNTSLTDTKPLGLPISVVTKLMEIML